MESEDESDERIAAIVFGLAALFEDQSGIVELPAGFSTAKAGARLRQQLSRRLNAMSAEDRKLFDDDAQIVTLAVNVFFEELLMMADAWFQTTDREPDEAAFHDFLSQETLHAWMLGSQIRVRKALRDPSSQPARKCSRSFPGQPHFSGLG